jgi:hypothetical protein
MITQLRNILIQYEEELPINSTVVGVSCALQITHSVVQTAAALPVHVLAVQGKFSHYFSPVHRQSRKPDIPLICWNQV